MYDWLNKLIAFSVFQLLYITLAFEKMDRRGISNTEYCEHQPRRLR